MTESELDPVLLSIFERWMKGVYISHAIKEGADEKFVEELRDKDWRVVAKVVSVLYGEPEVPKRDEEGNIIS